VKKKIIILLFLLTFPSVFYVILTTGKANFIRLNYFGEKKLTADGKDTIHHSIPPFILINQKGETITDKDYDGKIYVANYFCTNCNTIVSRKIIAELLRVQEKFAFASESVRLLSLTMKPDADSVPALDAYSKLVHADTKTWSFATGDKKLLYNIAKNGYLLNTLETTDGTADTVQSEKLVLVDKEKHIRGFYDGSNIKEVNNLLDDIKVLIAEYYIKDEIKKDKLEKKKKE